MIQQKVIPQPREQCREYMKRRGFKGHPHLVSRECFERYVRDGELLHGPETEYISEGSRFATTKRSFQRYGIREDGIGIFCETNRNINSLARYLTEGETVPIPTISSA